MNITLNGEPVVVPESTNVFALIAEGEHGKETKGIAIACNGEVVRRGAWRDFVLHEGDAVEVVKAAQGG